MNELKQPSEAIKDPKMFRLSWYILAFLLIGYFASEFLSIPVSVIAGVIAILFLVIAQKSPAVQTKSVLKEAPWAIVFFSIGMYVVVYGMRNAGLTDALSSVIQAVADQGLLAGILGMGFIAAILSSVMNNMPTVMIDALAISGTDTQGMMREALIYANVIGSDLGPKLRPLAP